MYVDGVMIFLIYIVAVVSLAVSVYALWSLEEIRKYYDNRDITQKRYQSWKNKPPVTIKRSKGHWD